MVISAQSVDLRGLWTSMNFPLVLIAAGIFVSFATQFVATKLMKVRSSTEVESSLKRQLVVSTVLMTGVTFAICYCFFPTKFDVAGKTDVKNWHIFFCVMCGLWSGLLIGFVTEYYTSHSYTPVREVANACKTGAATNIIYGLALGYKSVIIPVIALAVTIYTSYSLAAMYGIATAALGILSTLATGLAIDAYGPICDNAGGIAEMSGMSHDVRDITDALDAAGNTTAAIGKGFAIGSAALVSLALFGAFVTTVQLAVVDILQPFEFAGLIVGAMLPYWFSALTMKSVGIAALEMVEEVRRQFRTVPTLPNGDKDFSRFQADYSYCVRISTNASLKMMIAPGALVMLTPLFVGFLFGAHCLAGILAGALVSGVQMAISGANTGGAWDNAKKYIESGALGEGHLKGSDSHKAAVVGDTVGDPLKDTSGPSLNILIKLMAIISLVFGPAFPNANTYKNGYIGDLFGDN
jgi:inorganic pyrophosphatase